MKTSMKHCSRIQLQRMACSYAARILKADNFRASFDTLFFSAVRTARETDALRQFDRYKEAESELSRLLASVYLEGMRAGAELENRSSVAVCRSAAPVHRKAGSVECQAHADPPAKADDL